MKNFLILILSVCSVCFAKAEAPIKNLIPPDDYLQLSGPEAKINSLEHKLKLIMHSYGVTEYIVKLNKDVQISKNDYYRVSKSCIFIPHKLNRHRPQLLPKGNFQPLDAKLSALEKSDGFIQLLQHKNKSMYYLACRDNKPINIESVTFADLDRLSEGNIKYISIDLVKEDPNLMRGVMFMESYVKNVVFLRDIKSTGSYSEKLTEYYEKERISPESREFFMINPQCRIRDNPDEPTSEKSIKKNSIYEVSFVDFDVSLYPEMIMELKKVKGSGPQKLSIGCEAYSHTKVLQIEAATGFAIDITDQSPTKWYKF
jgi:hypothetical protein